VQSSIWKHLHKTCKGRGRSRATRARRGASCEDKHAATSCSWSSSAQASSSPEGRSQPPLEPAAATGILEAAGRRPCSSSTSASGGGGEGGRLFPPPAPPPRPLEEEAVGVLRFRAAGLLRLVGRIYVARQLPSASSGGSASPQIKPLPFTAWGRRRMQAPWICADL
jgi:hypothetical protein